MRSKTTGQPVATAPAGPVLAPIVPPSAGNGALWRGIAFFGALFLCLWLGVDGRLIYHGGPEIQRIPVFYWGADFAGQFIGRPGGIGEYLMALGMQAFYYSWYGALAFVGASILVWAAVRKYARSLGAPVLAGYVLPLLALALYSMYVPACRTLQDALAACLALWVYSSLPAGVGTALRAGVFAGLAGALFAISPGGLIVFVAACIALELAQARWTAAVLALGIGAGVAALEGCVLYGYGGAEVWELLLPARMDWARARQSVPGAIAWLGLAGFVPLLGWTALALKPFRFQFPRGKFLALLARRGLVFSTSWLRPLLAAGVVLCVYVCARDGHLKSRTAADYFASQGLWEEAFAAAKNETRSPIAACLALRAAYHTGRLTRQMLDIPSPDDVTLEGLKGVGVWTRSGVYLDLGYANGALHNLTEAVEGWGERPMLLKSLVLANMAIGNTNTALLYVNRLTRAPFHSDWAKNYLRRYGEDPTLRWDDDFTLLRQRMPKDDLVRGLAPENQLLMLLKAHPDNRMAYEYLMTYYLLTRQMRLFGNHFGHLWSFQYHTVPPLWEDAAVVCAKGLGDSVLPEGYQLSERSLRALDEMKQALARLQGDKKAARNELKAAYGDTYFFYHLYAQ